MSIEPKIPSEVVSRCLRHLLGLEICLRWSLSLAKMCRGMIQKWLDDVRKDPDLKVWLVLPKSCPEVLASFPEKLEVLGDLLDV